MLTVSDFKRVKNDVNGNPRYVAHFLKFLTQPEINNLDIRVSESYEIALKRARKFGGKKFHNKQFGGGIVFVSYCLELEVCAPINAELER